MSDDKSAEATMVLVEVAGRLLQASVDTEDERIKRAADAVVKELKDGQAFESLLMLFANQQQQSNVPNYGHAGYTINRAKR